MLKEYYAIEEINYRAWAIKQVRGDWILPLNNKAYQTLKEATTAADEMGLEIKKIGSSYQII